MLREFREGVVSLERKYREGFQEDSTTKQMTRACLNNYSLTHGCTRPRKFHAAIKTVNR